MVNFVLLLFVVALSCSTVHAQLFSRITDSPVATDGGSSANASFVDVDNDGDLDIFITNDEADQGNFLYLNDGTGTFTSVEGDPILETGGHNVGATWGDYDNDGDLDCFVARWSNQTNKLYENNGDGTFASANLPPLTNMASYSETGSWADWDNDGLLDLFVTNSAGPNHRNFLYRALEIGVFERIMIAPFTVDGDDSRSADWCDFNADGWLDLFVANENNDNDALYVSNGDLSFTRRTNAHPGIDGVNNFTSSWGDIDNDADFDLFVGTYDGPSILYRNVDGTFVEVENSPVSIRSQNAVGSAFADYNNDSYIDLLVTSGFASNGSILRENVLYSGNGQANFSPVEVEPIDNDSGWGFGCAFGDIDGDQDLDLCIARSRNGNEDNLLYRNNGIDNVGLVIRLRGTTSNRSAIGARVYCTTLSEEEERTTQVRMISGQSGYCGQTLEVHFGLGEASAAESLIVYWPSSHIDTFLNVLGRQTITITEDEGIVNADQRETPIPTDHLLLKTYPNPFNANVTFEAALPNRALTKVEVFNTLGQHVATLHEGMAGPGNLSLNWQPSGLASGMYLVTATQGELSDTQSVQFIK